MLPKFLELLLTSHACPTSRNCIAHFLNLAGQYFLHDRLFRQAQHVTRTFVEGSVGRYEFFVRKHSGMTVFLIAKRGAGFFSIPCLLRAGTFLERAH